MIVYQIKIIQHTGNDQSEKLVFDSSRYDEMYMLQDPVCKLEIGKAGSLEFKVLPTSEFYNSFNRLTTEIYLTEDSNEIFRGRVYETTVGIDKIKEVTCEGDIAYLSDTILDPDRVKVPISETGRVTPIAYTAAYSNLEINDSLPVVCACSKQGSVPTITVNCVMTVTFKGTTYNLAYGSNHIAAIAFDVGDNPLTFSIPRTVYSRYSAYSIGDVTSYNGNLYRCISPVTPPTPVDPDVPVDPDAPYVFEFDWDKWEMFRGKIESIVYDGTTQEKTSYEFSMDGEEGIKETVAAHFTRIIGNHNGSQSSPNVEEWKQFTVGNITVDDADKIKEFDAANYRDSYDAIDSDIIDLYGGYLRTRRVGGQTVIDLLKSYSTQASQHLTFGENVIEFSDERDASDMFTILIPIGDDDLTIKDANNGSKMLINQEAVNLYGKIYKVEQFSGISDAAELKRAAEKYMEREIDTDPCEISITAYDLKHFNPYAVPIQIGDKVTISCPELGVTRTCDCMEKTINLLKPESTEYVLGKNKQSLSTKSRRKDSSSDTGIADGSSRGRSAGGSAGKIYKTLIETGNDLLIQADKLRVLSDNIEVNNARIRYYDEVGVSSYNLGKALETIEEIQAQRIVTKGLTVLTATDLHGSLLVYAGSAFHGNVDIYGLLRIGGIDVSNPVLRVQDSEYVNNTKTVKFFKRVGVDEVTFSRAVSAFSVSAQSGTLTVNTTPQEQATLIILSIDYSRDGNGYTVWVNMDTVSGSGGTGCSTYIDAGDIYRDGQASITPESHELVYSGTLYKRSGSRYSPMGSHDWYI